MDKEVLNLGFGSINVTGIKYKNPFYYQNVVHGYFGKDKFTN